MCSEDGWFTVAAVRSVLIKHLDGNTSHLHKLLLKHLFFNRVEGNDFRTGVELHFNDGTIVQFFATLMCFIGDGDALKHVLHCKGSSGFKICFLCDVVDHTAPNRIGYVSATCLDPDLITRSKDETVYAILEELADLEGQCAAGVKGAKTALAERSKHAGWNYNANNVFLDDDLRTIAGPVSSAMYD